MRMTRCMALCVVLVAFHSVAVRGEAKPDEGRVSGTNLLKNPSFEEGLDAKGVPKGWSRYGGGGKDQRLSLTKAGMLIEDDDAKKPFGISQTVGVKGGGVYTVVARVRAVKGGRPNAGTLILRLGSSNTGMTQFGKATADSFSEFSLVGKAAANAKSATIYVYSRKQPNCRFLVESVRLVEGGKLPAPGSKKPSASIGRRAPGLEAKPPPVYRKLKNLHLTTQLVRNGKPTATIIASASGAYDDQAKHIAQAIRDVTRAEMPIVGDESPQAAVPIRGNVIVLGNRSTNRTIAELYNRHFTLLDLRYPGKGGHVVRTLHNPFGDGRNVVFVGGSDLAGVRAATAQFVKRLKAAAKERRGRDLAVGWVADIQLPRGLEIPKDMTDSPLWSASEGYRNSGVFGWTVMTKRAALYYMTGDPFHAREFLRLSFPDKKAAKEIRAIDKGKVDIRDPLTGLDHYRFHRLIMYWDLIEESPVFTDDERLRVTNAFARSLKYRKKEGAYRHAAPAPKVSSRHGQWGAVCVFTLCRYFARDYPGRVWKEGLKQARWEFASLHEYDWVHGENDNLFWYTTSMEPLVSYLLLSGDRVPLRNGVLKKLMKAQETLFPGTRSHKHVRYGALNYFHKVAYLMQDGRWIHYRDQTTLMDDDVPFRLGQSFWPEPALAAKPPTDLCGKWTVDFVPEVRWKSFRNNLPRGETFTFAGFRSQPGADGDYILIDGYNGQGRNPYHCFSIFELRIDGHTVLRGHENQLVAKVDGMVEPVVARFAALKRCGVVGDTAFVTAEVPNHAYCNWRRTLAQRVGRYVVVADRLTFRAASENVEVQTKWWTPPHTWAGELNRVDIPMRKDGKTTEVFAICPSDMVQPRVWKLLAILSRYLSTRKGQSVVSFSLIAPTGAAKSGSGPACMRIAENAAALRLRAEGKGKGIEKGIVVSGEYEQIRADLAIMTESHLHGLRLTQAGLGQKLLVADRPIDADWAFAAGRLHVQVEAQTRLSVALGTSSRLRLDGKSVRGEKAEDDMTAFALPAGRHVLEGARPSATLMRATRSALAALDRKAATTRAKEMAERGAVELPDVPSMNEGLSANVGGKIVSLEVINTASDSLVAAAVGKTIRVLSSDGRVVRTLETDADMRVIHWWQEPRLLLAGCKDEKVIAFALDPNRPSANAPRRWTFVSKMAPWVYTHQASHWWKEAGAHHAGIHGLTSGRFLDRPKTQAIVGSACTVEILDQNGKLLERKEQVWGDVVHMLIVPKSDGSRDLLSLRRPSLSERVNILNSTTLHTGRVGFFRAPAGHTGIQSWGRSRWHLFHEDLDGDGVKEVIGDINGPWDRVGVWNESGVAKYGAPFGPGLRSSRSLRDLDVADLTADGKKEILVGTDRGLIVVLDYKCEKVWSKMLHSPPTVFKAIAAAGSRQPWLVVGCEDGTVLALDGDGAIIRRAAVSGRPQHIASLIRGGRTHVLLTTSKGNVKSFEIGE